MYKVIAYAKKTMLALKNPYGSVLRVFPNAINAFEKSENVLLLGVKDHSSIPHKLVHLLESNNMVLHTIDSCSLGGRAIDYRLFHPVHGGYMTGSSSGTALNVFLGINDIGIGTDGGGSVLAPALSLNLFGFISPLIEREYMEKFRKVSTDEISFVPSIGFISKDLQLILDAISIVLQMDLECQNGIDVFEVNESLNYNDRKACIDYLQGKLSRHDVVIEYNKNIDVFGKGDSVYGHYDLRTQEEQKKSNKGLLRVANMVGATALAIPSNELSSGYVLFCKSDLASIRKMLAIAPKYCQKEDAMIKKYFGNIDMYFDEGYFNRKV